MKTNLAWSAVLAAAIQLGAAAETPHIYY